MGVIRLLKKNEDVSSFLPTHSASNKVQKENFKHYSLL